MVSTADCIYRDTAYEQGVSIGGILVIETEGSYSGYIQRDNYRTMCEEWEPQDGEEVVSVHSKGLIRW